MAKRKLENENGRPEGWEDTAILVRDGRGEILRIEIPDDEEGGENHAADD